MRPNSSLSDGLIVRTGSLREFCELQRTEKKANENGFKVTNEWTTYARVKCGITQETMFAQAIRNAAGSTYNDIYFTVRYRSDIEANHRLIYRNKIYRIFSLADKTGTKEYMELRCQEIWD